MDEETKKVLNPFMKKNYKFYPGKPTINMDNERNNEKDNED